jgi:hypothetical protein
LHSVACRYEESQAAYARMHALEDEASALAREVRGPGKHQGRGAHRVHRLGCEPRYNPG